MVVNKGLSLALTGALVLPGPSALLNAVHVSCPSSSCSELCPGGLTWVVLRLGAGGPPPYIPVTLNLILMHVSTLSRCLMLAVLRHCFDSCDMSTLQGSADWPMLYLTQPGSASVHLTCLQSNDMCASQGAAGLPVDLTGVS